MLRLIKEKIDFFFGSAPDHSEFIIGATFLDELSSKAHHMLLPASILSMIAWIPFLFLDIALYPELPVLIILRIAGTSIGVIIFFCLIINIFKKKHYFLLFSLIFTFSLISGLILGCVKGDPIYMGGYCIVLLIIPFIPLRRLHSLIIILISLSSFLITGLSKGMTFSVSHNLYGLLNMIIAFIASILAIYYFDKDRKTSYGKSYLIQQTNEALENSNREISFINESIEKTARELNITNEELKRVIETKSEFLHIAVHNLKNPLQIILGYVEMLKLENNKNTTNIHKLKKIEKSVEQMIEIILKLLESEEIESGKYKKIRKQPIFINDILETIISKNQVQVEKKEQQIIFNNGNKVQLNSDPFIIHQIFENLISNAIKFSPNNTNVIINIFQKSDHILITIKDEGPGFNEKDMENLFKKFKKLSAKPTGNENSSGLGLSIVKQYIDLIGGKVYASNNKDLGATFYVELYPN